MVSDRRYMNSVKFDYTEIQCHCPHTKHKAIDVFVYDIMSFLSLSMSIIRHLLLPRYRQNNKKTVYRRCPFINPMSHLTLLHTQSSPLCSIFARTLLVLPIPLTCLEIWYCSRSHSILLVSLIMLMSQGPYSSRFKHQTSSSSSVDLLPWGLGKEMRSE